MGSRRERADVGVPELMSSKSGITMPILTRGGWPDKPVSFSLRGYEKSCTTLGRHSVIWSFEVPKSTRTDLSPVIGPLPMLVHTSLQPGGAERNLAWTNSTVW